MPANLILIGPSGVGKSTVLATLVERLRLQGRTVRGCLSASAWEDGKRIGWRLDACDGSGGGWFARRDIESAYHFGPYGADMALFERIATAQLTPIDSEAVYIIDEIGFAPEWSPRTHEATLALLDSAGQVVAITRLRDDGQTPFAEEVKRRPDVELIEVTLENRDALPDELARRLAQ